MHDGGGLPKGAVRHDPCNAGDRWPLGAVEAGACVRLSCRVSDDAMPLVSAIDLVISERGEVRTVPLEMAGGRCEARIVLGDGPHVVRYAFAVHAADDCALALGLPADGRSTEGELGQDEDLLARAFQISVCEPGFTTPEWMCGAVMYQVFPDRFARCGEVRGEGLREHASMGRPVHLADAWDAPVHWWRGKAYDPCAFFGGTLDGVRAKLDYLATLGVDVIYLNPVFEARSYHRYDTADYTRIDPLLGDEEDFKRLAEEARGKGMRVVLDAVLSHTGADSYYFNAEGSYGHDGAAQGPASPFHVWYDFSAQENGAPYRCWWGDPSLPEVNERDASWQACMFGGAFGGEPEHRGILPTWLARGAAGYRLDVADEIPDDVLSRLRACVKSADPDAVIIGEVWEDATTKESYGAARTYALGTSLDSVMNYPLRDALIGFALGRTDAYQLATFIKLQKSNYPAPLYGCLMNLLTSHDVERVRSVLSLGEYLKGLPREAQDAAVCSISAQDDARGARLQAMLATLIYALPGAPCVYYGDERGMQGGADPFCRAPMVWGHPDRGDYGADLTGVYAQLGGLRKRSQALRAGEMACFAIDADALCIVRLDGSDVAVAVANRAQADRTIVVDFKRAGIERQLPGVLEAVEQLSGLEDGMLALRVEAQSCALVA